MNVSTLDDSILEREKEEFTVSLELAEWGGSGVMLGHSVAMATILDDDSKAPHSFSTLIFMRNAVQCTMLESWDGNEATYI